MNEVTPPSVLGQAILDAIRQVVTEAIREAGANGNKSGDEYPVFFASELLFLRKMTPDELRRRYAEKRALCGGWIRDRFESTAGGDREPVPRDTAPPIRIRN